MEITVNVTHIIIACVIALIIGVIAGAKDNMVFELFRLCLQNTIVKLGLPVAGVIAAVQGLDWVSIYFFGVQWPVLVFVPIIAAVGAAIIAINSGW